jgi:hypothetical protein
MSALDEARYLVAERVSLIELHGQAALAYLMKGEWQASLHSAEAALELIRKDRASSFSTLAGIAGTAESFLELWHRSVVGEFDADCGHLESRMRAAMRSLKSFAKAFEIGLPRAKLLEGRYRAYRGEFADAVTCWKEAASAAARLSTLYELAVAATLIEAYSTDRVAGAHINEVATAAEARE